MINNNLPVPADPKKVIKKKILLCVDCNTLIYPTSEQIRCLDCAKVYRKAYMVQWRKNNLEHRAIYERERMCGGNWYRTLERDNFICQLCGDEGTQHTLEVHHIDKKGRGVSFSEKNNNLDNLLTLCKSCHTTLHHREDPLMSWRNRGHKKHE